MGRAGRAVTRAPPDTLKQAYRDGRRGVGPILAAEPSQSLPPKTRIPMQTPLCRRLAGAPRRGDRAQGREEGAQRCHPFRPQDGGELGFHAGNDVEGVFDLLPAACGEPNQSGASVGGVRDTFEVPSVFQVLDEVGHGRFGHLRLGGEVGNARPLGFDVLEHDEVSDPQVVITGVVKAP